MMSEVENSLINYTEVHYPQKFTKNSDKLEPF